MRNLQSFSKAAEFLTKKRRHRKWARLLSVMICVVVFCTAYALILPALTLEREAGTLDCQYAAHSHTEDCYGEDGSLICGYADFTVHTHDAGCYDEDGRLICSLPEIKEHTHTEECYGQQAELICGLEESERHTHDEDCYDVEGNLICGLEESEGHTHDDSCYEIQKALICDKEEVVLHTHTEECYDEDGILICGQLETLEHVHGDECFTAAEEETIEAEDEEEKEIVSFGTSILSAVTSIGSKRAASQSRTVSDQGVTSFSNSDNSNVITDNATIGGYESILGVNSDGVNYGTRYAGRVWSDKSVITDSFTENGLTYENDSDFLTVFSALGSSRVIKRMETTPLDVVLVLDVSNSMTSTDSSGTTRIESTVDAANSLINELMSQNDNSRVGLVAFAENTTELLSLDHYATTGSANYLTYNSRNESVTVRATSSSGNTNQSVALAGQTFTQAGIYEGMQMLSTENETTVEINGENITRTPVVIILSDGVPTGYAETTNWWQFDKTKWHSSENNRAPRVLATLLTAAYEKNQIEETYGVVPKVFTIAAGVTEPEELAYVKAILNPGVGFTGDLDKEISETDNAGKATTLTYEDAVTLAYQQWNKYLDGEDITMVTKSGSTNNTYTFRHPSSGDVTDVNYVDDFFEVADGTDGLVDAFDTILNEVTSNAFIPTQDTLGDTHDTGIIYTDPLGEYMEFKDIKGVLIDGKEVPLTTEIEGEKYYATIPRTEDGEITRHPIYGTEIGGEQIVITVETDADGMQTLKVEVPSVILPARCETVNIDKYGTAAISTETSLPLRVLYTVGVKDSIKNTGGEIDLTQVSGEYKQSNTEDGSVYFYSNLYDSNTNNGYGNATVQFSPSLDNRYYYFQTNRAIYSSIFVAGEGEVTNTQYEGILKTVGSDGKTEEPGTVSMGNPVGGEETLDDDTYYYLIIDYYRPESDVANADGSYPAEHVYHVVSRTGAELKNSVESVPYSTPGLVTGGEGVTSEDTQVLATTIGGVRLGRMSWFTQKKDDGVANTSGYYYVPTYTDVEGDGVDTGTIETFTVYLGNNGRLAVPDPTDLTIVKVDSTDTDTVLKGAEFVLYYTGEDGKEYYYYNNNGTITWELLSEDSSEEGAITLDDVKLTSGEDGIIEMENIPNRSYTLKEITAPDGYNLLTEAVTFSVSSGEIVGTQYVDENNKTTLIIPNSTGIALPNTGGPGRTLYTMAGLLLMFSAICLMYKNKNRRKEANK